MFVGTVVNALAVLCGSLLGMLLSRLGRRVSQGPAEHSLGKRLQAILIQGVALCVVYLGFSGSLQGRNSLIAIVSMVLGGLVGESLDLDGRLQDLGQWVQEKTARFQSSQGGSVAEGFVTASLIYCVGAMAITGALQDGLTQNHETLFAKSLLDGISSIVYGASLGIGVTFSALSILLYQGAIALAASWLEPLLTGAASGGGAVLAEMNCVGSLLIAAIGLNMLGVTKIKVMNLVPGMFLPILLCRWL